MKTSRRLMIAAPLLALIFLGWSVPATHAAEPWCDLQHATAASRHTDMPCCPHPTETPATMSPQCQWRCARLHTVMGVAGIALPVLAHQRTILSTTPTSIAPRLYTTLASFIDTPAHAPPRRYALLCIYRC